MIRHWMARAGLLFATAALIAPLYAGEAAAQGAPATYPARPIRVIVPFPAGGPSDVGMRVIAQKMTDRCWWTIGRVPIRSSEPRRSQSQVPMATRSCLRSIPPSP